MYLINSTNPFYSEFDTLRKENLSSAKERVSIRDNFERDFGRIVHSSAFRRLQSKTQVIGTGEGDFHRTRLTHSLEVSQIARGIATTLNFTDNILKEENKIDISLIEAAALAHDLGHPPFGHQGEKALHKSMSKFNLGFEGNAHTFRLLTNLEGSKGSGLDLTRATLLSILKYPATIDRLNNEMIVTKPPKTSVFKEDEVAFEWLLDPFSLEEKEYITSISEGIENKHKKTLTKTLECSIIELADDIAYATHDFQDAVKLNLIRFDDVMDILRCYKDTVSSRIVVAYTKVLSDTLNDERSKIKDLFADLISAFIADIRLSERNDFPSNRLRYVAQLSEGNLALLNGLKKLVEEKVILTQRVQTIEWRGGFVISNLFNAMFHNELLLPEDDRKNWSNNDEKNARIVCDYLAGMTDSFALKMYSRLFESSNGRLFDI
ncbi:dGTPase [Paenibacillus sp. GSMTC-2017]|uniref:anti-phage deoxyguanosine triphosphatase n=1 Tax=Paenibacillus sp. GSMTC-2017 TaxID=2794350 RepID=UPI0018D83D7D|nr:anti-phage deoxyguanosine triphosphatase [Paenibacillus sp. GSMTC-2017]MBH5319478.1 dGTPase [Paenibacillus sp. GSMTC-2017]